MFWINLPIYNTIVTNTIKPNQILKAAIKYVTAIIISIIVGAIENSI